MGSLFSRRHFLKLATSIAPIPFFQNFSFHLSANPSSKAPNQFHLTAFPWTPLNTENAYILDLIEGLCRFSIQYQNESGAIIDPIIGREHQYATPYFAHALGTLIHAGVGGDLWEAGIIAMDHATKAVEGGNLRIPDKHGEFFIAPLASAITLYGPLVDEDTLSTWRQRLSKPVEHIIESIKKKTNNWRTYAMKGEWHRYNQGLISRQEAVQFIEDGWQNRTQRERNQNR